jgi:SEC-C motif domain protein
MAMAQRSPRPPEALGPACPCGRRDARERALPLARCCGPFLDGAPAPDAHSLMRSRYTAYALGRDDYLRATWHPDTRPASVDLEPGVKWLGLEVRDHRPVDERHAEVEFVARYRVGGRAVRLHERSRFTREADGRWYYVAGDVR